MEFNKFAYLDNYSIMEDLPAYNNKSKYVDDFTTSFFVIYLLTYPNGKHYVGQTMDFGRRMSKHKAEAKRDDTIPTIKRNRMKSKPICDKAIEEFGWNNVKKEILCTVPIYYIDLAEQYFIKLYKSNEDNYGYNIHIGGYGNKIHDERTKKRMSISSPHLSGENHPAYGKKGKDCPNSKIVYQYDLQGNLIKKWDSGADVSRELNVKHTTLHEHIRFNRGYLIGFIFRKELLSKEKVLSSIRKPKLKIPKKGVLPGNIKKVYQYDLNCNLIKIWDYMMLIDKELGINFKLVSSHCIHKRINLNGFIFRYSPMTKKEIIEINKYPKNNKERNNKITYQYDLRGNLIKIWKNAKQICIKLNIGKYALYKHIKMNKIDLNGFIFRYIKLTDKEINQLKNN